MQPDQSPITAWHAAERKASHAELHLRRAVCGDGPAPTVGEYARAGSLRVHAQALFHLMLLELQRASTREA